MTNDPQHLTNSRRPQRRTGPHSTTNDDGSDGTGDDAVRGTVDGTTDGDDGSRTNGTTTDDRKAPTGDTTTTTPSSSLTVQPTPTSTTRRMGPVMAPQCATHSIRASDQRSCHSGVGGETVVSNRRTAQDSAKTVPRVQGGCPPHDGRGGGRGATPGSSEPSASPRSAGGCFRRRDALEIGRESASARLAPGATPRRWLKGQTRFRLNRQTFHGRLTLETGLGRLNRQTENRLNPQSDTARTTPRTSPPRWWGRPPAHWRRPRGAVQGCRRRQAVDVLHHCRSPWTPAQPQHAPTARRAQPGGSRASRRHRNPCSGADRGFRVPRKAATPISRGPGGCVSLGVQSESRPATLVGAGHRGVSADV